MKGHTNKKVEDILLEAASKFFLMESAGSALVTITSIDLSPKGDRAVIFFSVLPEEKEKVVLEFAKRKRSDFREFIKSETKIQRLPFIDFEIDIGEKNRQNIDRISNISFDNH